MLKVADALYLAAECKSVPSVCDPIISQTKYVHTVQCDDFTSFNCVVPLVKS